MRFIEGYALGATTAVIVLSLVAFRGTQHPHFDEIDVGRINVVEKDGSYRMILSNHAQFPDPIIHGKSYPVRGGDGALAAGIIFFNDENTEQGGLAYHGKATPGGHRSSGFLSFDQYEQNEGVTIGNGEKDNSLDGGMTVQDNPHTSIQMAAESLDVIGAMPAGAEKDRRLKAFRDEAVKNNLVGSKERVYAGRTAKNESVVRLSDDQGRLRIKMAVDSLGHPSLVLLDENGKVIDQMPKRP